MALKAFALRSCGLHGHCKDLVPAVFVARSLSTGPQPPDPHSPYFGHWNVSERVIQRPHSKYMKTNNARLSMVKKKELQKQNELAVRRQHLINKNLLEAGERGTDEPSLDDEGEDNRKGLPEKGLAKLHETLMVPEEVDRKMFAIIEMVYHPQADFESFEWDKLQLTDLSLKFQFLSQCSSALERIIPNSRLNSMQTAAQVLSFYQEPPSRLSYFRDLDFTTLPNTVGFGLKKEKALHLIDREIKAEHTRRKATWHKPVIQRAED